MDPESFQVCLNFQWATKTFDGLIFQDNFLDVTPKPRGNKEEDGQIHFLTWRSTIPTNHRSNANANVVGVGHLG